MTRSKGWLFSFAFRKNIHCVGPVLCLLKFKTKGYEKFPAHFSNALSSSIIPTWLLPMLKDVSKLYIGHDE
jgi:hypothetical protein